MPVTELPATELEQALSEAAAEVLETMFFSAMTPDSGTDPLPDASWISAGLRFHGKPSGEFGVGIPAVTGRKIAANFLGADESEVTEPRIGQVVSELANMLCGSVLSRIEKDTLFDLSSPQLLPEPGPSPFIVHVEEGPLAMWMGFDF